MKLKEYLFFEKKTIKQFAKDTDYSATHMWEIVNEKRIPSKRMAKIIEKATNGEVTIADLIPEIIDNQ